MNIPTYEAEAGENIVSAVQRVQKILFKQFDFSSNLIFNGVTVRVTVESYPADIAEIYSLKCEIRRLQR